MAAWSPDEEAWRYIPLHGLAFGLASAVVSFNRLPTLLTATARRVLVSMVAAYFDDMPVLDTTTGTQSAPSSLIELLHLVGAPPGDGKVFPLSQYRQFLGVDVRLAQALSTGTVTLAPTTCTMHVPCA